MQRLRAPVRTLGLNYRLGKLYFPKMKNTLALLRLPGVNVVMSDRRPTSTDIKGNAPGKGM